MTRRFSEIRGQIGLLTIRSTTSVVAIVINWDTTPVFVKATGDLSQPGRSPVCNYIVFALFEQKYVSQR